MAKRTRHGDSPLCPLDPKERTLEIGYVRPRITFARPCRLLEGKQVHFHGPDRDVLEITALKRLGP